MKYFIFAIVLFFLPHNVFAATAGLTGPLQVQVGRTFQVRMTVQGATDVDTVRFIGSFPSDLIELQGMSNGSALPTRSPGSTVARDSFNFGGFSLEESINGGATAGALTFKALKKGEAVISLKPGTRILSAGEDQLSNTSDLRIRIIDTPTANDLQTESPAGVVVEVFSKTHPNQDTWHKSRALSMEWSIVGRKPQSVFVGFDQAPEGPAEQAAILTNKATFTASMDGVWYGHLVIRFSPTEIVRKDFRFMIDSTEPRPFQVVTDLTRVSQNTPNSLYFAAIDDVSGIQTYEVLINGELVTSTSQNLYDVSHFLPGTYRAEVIAHDFAHHQRRSHIEFEVLARQALQGKMPSYWQRILLWILVLIGLFVGGFLGWLFAIKRRNKRKVKS